MSAQFDQVNVLEECQISPPPNSVPNTSLPLTFLDIPFFSCCPIQRVFLYKVPFSKAQFMQEVLPQLKNSLSLALQRFFPFCGNSVCPPEPSKPYILFTDGDSVPFFIAQSTGAFSDLLKDEPKDAREIHLLVPPTPPTRILDDKLVQITPLLALQVTLFPNTGVGIGMNYRHTVADGISSIHFMKTWASIFKADCDMSRVCISLPVHDKGVITDPNGNTDCVLEQWRAMGCPVWKETAALTEDIVRATFTFSRIEIEHLKKWISAKYYHGKDTSPTLHLSSFVVTSAFIWACLIKTLDVITPSDSSKNKELCHFFVLADCRNKYDSGVPVAYFGNCLSVNFVSVSRCKFKEEDCIITLAEAISHGVQGFKDGGLDGFKYALSKWVEVLASGENIVTIAGSPKLAEYDIDFGWGRPEKVEVVHIDNSGSISLSESGKDKGGIKVGLCRSRHEIEVFTSFFQAGLNQFV